MGADWCNSARGFMFALGCIQAQSCHTGKCPTGVTTQDPLRQRALVVPDKADRVASFHHNTLAALSELIAAAGLTHPAQFRPHHIVRRVAHNDVRLFSNLYPFLQPGELLDGEAEQPVFKAFWQKARPKASVRFRCWRCALKCRRRAPRCRRRAPRCRSRALRPGAAIGCWRRRIGCWRRRIGRRCGCACIAFNGRQTGLKSGPLNIGY